MTVKNIIMNTDTYKLSMPAQYPDGATRVFSYIESRTNKAIALGTDANSAPNDVTLFFGLQAFLQEYLTVPITKEDIDEAERFITAHGVQFNRAGWEYILKKHDGFLPVRIKAVPEGSIVPRGNVLVTVENTDPNCYWLTTHLETALLRAVWYPTTVATTSYHIKQLIKGYLIDTADNLDGLVFKLHDFGARGVSSGESAEIGGAAHLVNFRGTDTVSSLYFMAKYYDMPMAGFSIPASEHSIATSHSAVATNTSPTDPHGEATYIRTMLSFLEEGNMVAMVADSYDVYNFVDLLGSMVDEVKAATAVGKIVVIRPDSGVPVTVCTALVQKLDHYFGTTINGKGYKVLNNVRLIQGDGVSYDSIREILESFKQHGYSADNIAFGMGGALLQKHDRDELSFAMKCSSVVVKGVEYAVVKNPITDPNKVSKSGRIDLWYDDTNFCTAIDCPPGCHSAMNIVFENGKVLRKYSLDAIRTLSERG